MKNLSFANRWNADLIDENYQKWLDSDPGLDPLWQAFFEGFELSGAQALSPEANGTTIAATGDAGDYAKKQARAIGAIFAYRSIGHTQATINPLLIELPINPRLALDRLGFSDQDLDTVFHTGNYQGGQDITLRKLMSNLRQTYCGNIGIEYLHIQETTKRRFIQSLIEPTLFQHDFTRDQQKHILKKIIEAEQFEKFLHRSFVGQKRFSLEGSETLITALDTIAQNCPENNVEEIVMGMAHRGRLNVLANFIGKSHDTMFNEFSETHISADMQGDGDVKYHLGYDNSFTTVDGKEIMVRLSANPSHLEAVNPVVEGRARARQRILDDLERKRVLPVLIHGDAAIAGQGMVSEVLNFSQLVGYRTGGTIHIVVNNQIGFTTDPKDARSSRYCTDIAKMIEAPIFHVNGDDPLAVAYAAKLALLYRQKYSEDVFIDIYGYRRLGHNESDEPAFTQPLLYRKISSMPLISNTMAGQLKHEGIIDDSFVDEVTQSYTAGLESARAESSNTEAQETTIKISSFAGSNAEFQPDYNFQNLETGVAKEPLNHIANTLCTIPEHLTVNPKIARQLKTKWERFNNEDGAIDWAFAESLAWGSLLTEGSPVRLSGQDCERGTFSQRHSAIYDIHTRERYVPLMNLSEDQARYCVHNSLLSEAAVLGFDFGYSLEYPQMLCMWEAQFGDFVNGAQVIIDQFITSSESKWGRVSGIVMLLPHGYEGQGPEHSSARLERFLQACAENNIQVCNLTTPAQYFHVLRRQVKRSFRKPLIIMSPKSLLRHPRTVSTRQDFQDGGFRSILDDPQPGSEIDRVILCSGKIYYDLVAHREAAELKNAAIVRVEQFYPLNHGLLQSTVEQYGADKKIVWCQEESSNMGGWFFIAPQLEMIFNQKPYYCGRDASASPATGFQRVHKLEQQKIIEQAFQI